MACRRRFQQDPGKGVRILLRPLPFMHEGVGEFVARSIVPSATVVSDGLWCFGAVQLVGASHERVVTGGGKASTQLAQFRAVNPFLGNLKRSMGGTYHSFNFAKYPHHSLAEAQYRFNRRFKTRSILARLLRRLPHKPSHRLRHSCG